MTNEKKILDNKEMDNVEAKIDTLNLDMSRSKIDLFIQERVKRGIITSAFYQILIAFIFIALPYVVIEMLRLDLLLIFTIGNAWMWFTIGGIIIAMSLFQIIYAILIDKFIKNKTGIILGHIIGLFMCFIFPTGSFFGLLLLQYVRSEVSNDDRITKDSDDSKEKIQNSTGKQIIITGILMLHLPIILLMINKILIGLPLDMAYPIIKSGIYDDWDLMMWIFIAIFLGQIIIGAIYLRKGNNKWVKLAVIPFAIFQIFSFGLAINGFVIAIWAGLGLDTSLNFILYFAWIIGVILNPLGIYFGVGILKELRKG
jgi:MFS family permease